MYRFLYKNLVDWKQKPDRKPLVLFGARQTGKTWLLKEFGKKEYKNTAYINCENNPVLSGAFEDYDTRRLMVCYPSSRQLKKRKVFIIWITSRYFFTQCHSWEPLREKVPPAFAIPSLSGRFFSVLNQAACIIFFS